MTLVALLAGGSGAGAVVAVAYAQGGEPAARAAGDARVKGHFTLRGVITEAIDVSGEYRGERVRRTWAINPVGCVGSVCRRLQVVRNRGAIKGSYVVLRRVGRGEYRGSGAFWVGLRCLARTYRLGGRAPYTITLQVTQRQLVGTIWYATAVRATYTNLSRTDSTPCPLGPASDAARYSGRLSSALPRPPVTTTTPTQTVTTTTQTVTTTTGPTPTATGTTTTATGTTTG